MPKGYFFQNVRQFSDFVGLCRSSRSANQQYELVVFTGGLLLTGYKPSGLSGIFAAWKQQSFELEADNLRWKSSEGKCEAKVIAHRTGSSLADFLALLPDARVEVDTWYFLVKSDATLSQLVQQSLILGNDHLQFAAVGGGTLVKISGASFFLLEKFEESGEAEVYRQGKPDVFIRFGWKHPLEPFWNADPLAKDWWTFLSPDKPPIGQAASGWKDIYEIISAEADIPTASPNAEQVITPSRIKVPLRLVPAAKPSEPELWLLGDADLHKLEPLLAVLDQDDVVPYQVSVRQDASGQQRIFVREKIARDQRRHMEFAGQSFAPFLGLNNLFLPTGWTLLPPLRRHIYRDLFNLQPENLTIVVPTENNGFCLLALPERSFTPLTNLIDYLVESDATLLQERMDASIFELGPWAAAPSHSGLPRPAGAENAKASSAGLAASLETQAAPVEPEDESKKLDPTQFLRTEQQLSEESLSALQRKELELERSVIERQTVSVWQELVRIKLTLNKPEAAMASAVEALWLQEQHPAADLLRVIHKLATSQFPTLDDALGAAPHPIYSVFAAFRLLREAPEQDTEPWLRSMHVFLTAHETSLRIKERWLAWGWVFSKNGDKRREVQLRDEIRTAICERGLTMDNTPELVRTRLFLDRSNAVENNDAPGRTAEKSVAQLNALLAQTKFCKVASFKELWRSLLARAMARLGDFPAATSMLSGLNRSPDAWTALFISQSVALVDVASATQRMVHLESLLKLAEKSLADAVNDAKSVWDLRTQIDNPAAFLAQESRDRSYPKGGAAERGPLMELKREFEAAYRAGDEFKATSLMHNMLTLPDSKAYADAVKLPQFVDTLVTGLERYKWGLRGAGLLPLFISFANKAAGLVPSTDHFYAILLRASLCAGLMAADDQAGAIKQLQSALKLFGPNLPELDFIDGSAAVVRSIELLPMDQRGTLLSTLTQLLMTRFNDPKSHYFTRSRLYSALVRSVEQIVEAAVSRDRLSLELFRKYQLQDEFLILQRVQNETFTAQ